WPTWAAKPSATRMTPREKRFDESRATVIASRTRRTGRWVRQAGAAPLGCGRAAGLGSCGRPHGHGPRHDLEDQAAVRAGVDLRRPAEAAHRADHRQLVVAALAADGARRVDEPVAPAVRQPDWVDRLPTGADL